MLGIQVEAFQAGEVREQTTGWNEPERMALLNMIAERQPFLDFKVSRTGPDGTLHQFQISGEPMFNRACRFIGYRGIGVELNKPN
jgi:hypothetical protein